jgi:3-isopropylmalate/(R)-2-methylmalate dehydratase small subunit
MEDIDPKFNLKIKKGKTIIVAGKNFGMGSSREQAPLVMKEAGIIAVVAKSFARIFYRNGINIGMPLLEADTDKIKEGDSLDIDLEKGYMCNKTRNIKLYIKPLPKIMRIILRDGGIIKHFKKHAKLNL